MEKESNLTQEGQDLLNYLRKYPAEWQLAKNEKGHTTIYSKKLDTEISIDSEDRIAIIEVSKMRFELSLNDSRAIYLCVYVLIAEKVKSLLNSRLKLANEN